MLCIAITPILSDVRFFFFLTLLFSVFALFTHITRENNYLITSHTRSDADMAHHSAIGNNTASALK